MMEQNSRIITFGKRLVYVYICSLCIPVHAARAPRGHNMNQFKFIHYTEMTYLSNLLQSVPWYCGKPRIHTPLDWNHCHWENLANILRGAAIRNVSESLIFGRKSSNRIYGKWRSGDGKWSSSAGYSVITVFCYRQATVSSYFPVVKWGPVTLGGSLFLCVGKVQMESTLEWTKLYKKEFERNCNLAKNKNETRKQ